MEEQKSLTGRGDLAPVPEPGLSEAELVEFIPHRANRPEKTEGGQAFKMVSEFDPAGDQPQAIEELIDGIKDEERDQVLLGVTGSGKTFTMAQSFSVPSARPLCWPPTKHWRRSFMASLRGFSLKMRSSISSLITIITNPRHMCRAQILILKKKAILTSRLTACAIRQRGRCWSAMM